MRRYLLGTFAASVAGLLFCTGMATEAVAAPSTTGFTTSGTLRIMPLGDSITVGVGSPDRNGYRIELQRHLRAAGVTVDFVGSQADGDDGDLDHEGRGGWTIDRIAAQVGARLAETEPEVVLLHAGTNDITRGEKPDVAAGKLSALIDRIREHAPATDVFVAEIVGTTVPSENAANLAYNALIPGVVREKGPKVHLVDQSSVSGLDIYDAHHPNEFGYRKMAYTWYEALRGALYPDWPATGNPYQARKAFMCHAENRTSRDCRWWYLRRVIVSQGNGQTVTADRWQTQRRVSKVVRVWVAGHHEYRHGRKTWVPGRYVTRTRQITRWFNA